MSRYNQMVYLFDFNIFQGSKLVALISSRRDSYAFSIVSKKIHDLMRIIRLPVKQLHHQAQKQLSLSL